MLLLLIVWLYMLLIAYAFGNITQSLLARWVGHNQVQSLAIPVVIIMGLASISLLGSVFHFFSKINWGIHVLLIGGAMAWLVRRADHLTQEVRRMIWELRNLHPFSYTLFGLALVVAVLFSIIPSTYYDHGLYYHQFIKWLNTHAIVPGLGNLHPRLAFNSQWHVLSAVFSLKFVGFGSFNDINGFLHLVVIAYALGGVQKLIGGAFRVSNVFRATLIIPTHLIVGYFNAPSADVAVVYITWIIFILTIEKIESGVLRKLDIRTLAITFLAAYVCTVKLSAFPVTVIPIYFWLVAWQQGKTAEMVRIAVIIGGCTLPWLVRNVILSGYLLYPFYQLDLFSFDWKMPRALVREEASYILAFAINAFEPYPEVIAQSMGKWLPEWYARLRTANRLILFAVVGITGGALVYSLRLFLRDGRYFWRRYEGYLLLGFCLLLGLGFWFFKAPDFRFGYAFTVATYLLAFALIFTQIVWRSQRNRLLFMGLMGLLAIFYLRPVQIAVLEYAASITKTQQIYALCPATVPRSEKRHFVTPEGLKLYLATENDQCWDAPLPCTPFPKTGLLLRKPHLGLQAGFHILNPDVQHYRSMQIYYQPLPQEYVSPMVESGSTNQTTRTLDFEENGMGH